MAPIALKMAMEAPFPVEEFHVCSMEPSLGSQEALQQPQMFLQLIIHASKWCQGTLRPFWTILRSLNLLEARFGMGVLQEHLGAPSGLEVPLLR